MRPLRTSSTQPNNVLFWAVLVCLTLGAALLSLLFGAVSLSPWELWAALTGGDPAGVPYRILLYSRLPRTCAALLAGAALAVSGVVIQTVLHNPLASPGILGVNASAGLAVALLCAVNPTALRWTPLAAFLGALLGVLLILLLAEKTGASKLTVVLAGVAISNLFSAAIDGVVTLVPEALNGVTDFRIGGFSGVTLTQLAPAALLIALALIGILSLSHPMDILALGSDTAHSLGLSVRPTRVLLLTLAAALAGAAVSFAGLLGFVGLIVPHIMRRFVGEQALPLTVASILGGGAFVTLCDLLSRVVFAPFELPVGIVLAFAGVPFFLWLLFQQKGRRV